MSDDILELLKTTPAPAMSIDPYAAMADARSAQVRRRTLIGGTIAAGLAGIGALALQRPGTDKTLPAGDAPVTKIPVWGPPGQALDYSEVRATAGPRSINVELMPTSAGPQPIRLTLPLISSGVAGWVTGQTPDGTEIIAYAAPTMPRLLPADSGADPLTWKASGPITDSGLVLVVEPRRAAAAVSTLVWRDPGSGAPVFGDNSPLTVAGIDLPSGPARVWINRKHNQISYSVLGLESTSDDLPAGWPGTGQLIGLGALGDIPPGSTQTIARTGVIALLPKGAHDFRAIAAEATPNLEYGLTPLSDDSAVIAVATVNSLVPDPAVSSVGNTIKDVTWSDSAGKTHTLHPEPL